MNEYNKQALENAIKTKKMGHPLYFYPETDTTNDRIRELALEGLPEGTLAVAEMQTAGRGRMGRAWQMVKDADDPKMQGIFGRPGGASPDCRKSSFAAKPLPSPGGKVAP
jgi:hypothetical protein